jgi:DNA-binding LacI/PurR family transcriptional regulator
MSERYAPVMKEAEVLARELRHDILSGKHAPAEPFPSLRSLSSEYDARLRVVRAATDLLVKEGLLDRRERRGTFVRRLSGRPRARGVAPKLRCVTILERPKGTLPAFVRMDYLQGHTQALDAHPIRMRVLNLPPTPDRLAAVISDRHAFAEQGCILINVLDEGVFAWLREHEIPFVVQNYTHYHREALSPHHSVAVNKMGGAFAAVRRLIEWGHRRIGYAGSLASDTGLSLEVYEGYVAAMRCAGLELRSEDVFAFDTDDPEAAIEPMVGLLQNRSLPSAIMARTDSIALCILRATRLLGIRVPEDLSVIGFNDQTEAQSSEPPLTTVAVPRVQLGREAVETLLSVAAGDVKEPVSRVLDCYLVERGSAGRIRRTNGGERLTEEGGST